MADVRTNWVAGTTPQIVEFEGGRYAVRSYLVRNISGPNNERLVRARDDPALPNYGGGYPGDTDMKVVAKSPRIYAGDPQVVEVVVRYEYREPGANSFDPENPLQTDPVFVDVVPRLLAETTWHDINVQPLRVNAPVSAGSSTTQTYTAAVERPVYQYAVEMSTGAPCEALNAQYGGTINSAPVGFTGLGSIYPTGTVRCDYFTGRTVIGRPMNRLTGLFSICPDPLFQGRHWNLEAFYRSGTRVDDNLSLGDGVQRFVVYRSTDLRQTGFVA